MQISQFLVGVVASTFLLLVEYEYDVAIMDRKRQFVTCLSNMGEAYAVVGNIMYLLPLTYLFVMFFINSYGRKEVKAVKGKTN